MVALLNMSRAAWKRQPSGRVSVYWGNALSRYLCGGLVGGTLNDLVVKTPWVNNGTVLTTSSAGRGWYGAGSGYLSPGTVANLNFTTSNSFCWAFYIKNNNVGQTEKYLFFQKGSTMQLAIIYGYVANTFELFSNGYTGTDPRTSSQAVCADTQPAWLIYNYDGATLSVYYGGKRIGAVGKVFTFAAGTAAITTLLSAGGVACFDGAIFGSLFFSRGFSVAGLQAFAQNPWQLFQPAPSRFYLIPSSGGVITLIVQHASHGHSVEAPSLTQAHVLALADSLHGHSVESPILSQAYALTLAAAAHSHNVGSLDLTQAHSLSVAETSHTQSVDSVNLLQAHVLNLSEALHSHSVESPTLSAAGTLSVAEANHAHSVEAPSLIQAHTLAVQDASHSHSADALTLTQAYVLTPADATHGHSVEAPTLSTELNLAVADSLHSHTVDAPGLTQAHVLSVADALHSHIVESVAMGQGYSLIVADASHNHSAESPTVSVAFVLAIQDALHSQAAESLALATHVTLVVSDALHAHLAGTASEITLPTGDRIFLVAHEDRLFLVAAEDRLFGV